MRHWVGIIGCLISTQSFADDIPSAVETAFRDWLAGHSIGVGTLALMQDGQLVKQVGVGISVDTPREMASLSKAITAICALSLIEEGRWDNNTKLGDVLGQGPDLTVKQLMTHSAGLTTDSTQTAMPMQLDRPNAALNLKGIFKRGAEGPRGKFQYNNENYALLGAMIAAETSQNYEAACSERVLTPIGVSASLSPRTAAFDAYGGWAMSAADYAQFHHAYFGPEGQIGRDPSSFPKFKVGSAVYYGPGTNWRAWEDGFNFWHFGALCFPGRLNVGSFAVQYAIGWNLVATYDGCVDWSAMAALDRAMIGAIFEN
jgi:CubicO group peptidase (beta-lactamase class C family)